MSIEINYKHTKHSHNPVSANVIIPYILNLIKPTSVIDIGCGNGSWLKVFKDLGVNEIMGVDGISISEKDLYISKESIKEFNLSNELKLKRKFDLVVSLEVAEHLKEEVANTFIANLVNHGDVILFSAAIPNQGGQFHLNEQWPEYWNEKFRAQGFEAFDILRLKYWNNQDVLWWYKQNMLIFSKRENDKFKGFEPSIEVPSLIHPDLYRKKEFKPKFLSSNKEVFKSLINHLKVLFKNLFN